MTFYADMRDDVVAPLVRKFGRAAVYTTYADVYVPATGIATRTPTNTNVVLLSLPIERPRLRNLFREDLIEKASWTLLISAKELNDASIAVSANDAVTFGGTTYKVTGVNQVDPGGVPVLYKVLVEG
jgi:hypothetical protein